MLKFTNWLEKPYAAVACVEYKNTWLLGLATNNDKRKNKWCFPAGKIKSGETPIQAAIRECKEETGVTAKYAGKAFFLDKKPEIIFIYCKAQQVNLRISREMKALGFFSVSDIRNLRCYDNVLEIIKTIGR